MIPYSLNPLGVDSGDEFEGLSDTEILMKIRNANLHSTMVSQNWKLSTPINQWLGVKIMDGQLLDLRVGGFDLINIKGLNKLVNLRHLEINQNPKLIAYESDFIDLINIEFFVSFYTKITSLNLSNWNKLYTMVSYGCGLEKIILPSNKVVDYLEIADNKLTAIPTNLTYLPSTFRRISYNYLDQTELNKLIALGWTSAAFLPQRI